MKRQIILIVDQDMDYRQEIADKLRDCGHEVMTTIGLEEAVQVIRENEKINLLLTTADLKNEDDGIRLIKLMKMRKLMRRWLISDVVMPDHRTHAQKNGVEKVMKKSDLIENLKLSGFISEPVAQAAQLTFA